MKRELFDRIVSLVTEMIQSGYHKSISKSEPKITENDNIISYCWLVDDQSERITKAKEIFKEFGYKGSEVYNKISTTIGTNIHKTYFTLLYGKDTGKISISEFIVGYAYGRNKDRFYPLNKNLPLICFSKHLYTFNRFGKPRHAKGIYGSHGVFYTPIMKCIYGIDFDAQTMEMSRYYKGAKSDWDVLENKYACKIPKAMKVFNLQDVATLYDVLENKGEVNKICQYLAKNPVVTEDNKYIQDGLYEIISEMILVSRGSLWLIRDWMKDAQTLKHKISLKITSKKRIEDEHRKMSKLRMIKGISAIKVHDCYKDLFKDSGLDIELITDKKRLLQESIEQDHCVATYANQINSGSCAIFSIMHEGRRYTAQITRFHMNNDVQTYNVVQVKGFRNNRDSEELKNRSQEVTRMLEEKLGIFSNLERTVTGTVQQVQYVQVDDHLPF